jgi:hypothetical protein
MFRPLLGRGQVVKAPVFDTGIRRFESSRPSQAQGPGSADWLPFRGCFQTPVKGEPQEAWSARFQESARPEDWTAADRLRAEIVTRYCDFSRIETAQELCCEVFESICFSLDI